MTDELNLKKATALEAGDRVRYFKAVGGWEAANARMNGAKQELGEAAEAEAEARGAMKFIGQDLCETYALTELDNIAKDGTITRFNLPAPVPPSEPTPVYPDEEHKA